MTVARRERPARVRRVPGTRRGTRSAHRVTEIGGTLGRWPVGRPGAASPDRSPFTSATTTGMPAAESCSAKPCNVLASRCPSRLRSIRGDSSSTAKPAPAPRAPPRSCTPRPSSIAGPVVAYAPETTSVKPCVTATFPPSRVRIESCHIESDRATALTTGQISATHPTPGAGLVDSRSSGLWRDLHDTTTTSFLVRKRHV